MIIVNPYLSYGVLRQMHFIHARKEDLEQKKFNFDIFKLILFLGL